MAEDEEHILFGKFAPVECLKKDETGSVWLARHIHLEQPVILKILKLSSLIDPAAVERFKREARLLARLNHPNIIRVLDFSAETEAFYISCEYFPGVSLRARLQGAGLTLADKCGIFRQVAAALEAAHLQQIIHRDVKPENILIDDHGRVKLADFGLAQLQQGATLTRKSALVGTPGYMSPEQIRGEALTPASDLFALGIVAFELFFGRHPFIAADVGETLNTIVSSAEVTLPEDPGVPQALRELTAGLLRKEQRTRFGPAAEVVRCLQAALAEASPQSEDGRRPAGSLASDPNLSPNIAKGLEYDGSRPAGSLATDRLQAAHPAGTRAEAAPATPPAGSTLRRQKRLRLAGGALLALVMSVALLLMKYPAPLEQRFGTARTPGADSSAALSGWRLERFRLQRQPSAPAQGRLTTPAGEEGAEQLVHPPAESVQAVLSPPQHRLVPDQPREESSVNAVSGSSLPGKLYVTCEPWAEILIDSVRIDATPLQDTLRIFPGLHELMLKHPDYPPYRQQLRIQSRQSLHVAVRLDTLFGFVDLRIYPWAEVWVDGVQRGQTPFGRPLALEEGSHLLRLRHPQYGEVQEYFKIVKSETTRFTLNMSQLAGKHD
ncbi:MAG TPA: serine/threonine-protein kinase [bacterium]|nr:serine/threonine-protein kinase [bacterium]